MLDIFYEDTHLIVVKKPAGLECQARNTFEPDMVSQIRNHIRGLSTSAGEPYVGVIHRLDKPVAGIMVYGKSKKASAALSGQLKSGQFRKTYRAVVCGRPVDNVDSFVDYLLKDSGKNVSRIVEKGTQGAKRAELRYRVLSSADAGGDNPGPVTLVEVELLTGRHHQIRVQFAGHGLPLYGDRKYNPEQAAGKSDGLALCACGLSFVHPVTGKELHFSMKPQGGIFDRFSEM